jgi:hypothetical protein
MDGELKTIDRHVLRWDRPKWWQNLSLLTSEGGIHATLRTVKRFSDIWLASSKEGSWTFRTRRMLDPDISISRQGPSRETVKFTMQSDWNGILTIDHHRQYRFDRFNLDFRVTSPNEMMFWQRERWDGSMNYREVSIAEAGMACRDLLLLITFCHYLTDQYTAYESRSNNF